MGKLASKWIVQNWLDLKTVERFGDAWTGELKFFSVEKWNQFKTIFVSYPALTLSLSKTHSLNKTFRNKKKKFHVYIPSKTAKLITVISLNLNSSDLQLALFFKKIVRLQL